MDSGKVGIQGTRDFFLCNRTYTGETNISH